jgi:MoaA/NifB/PqqE/SkfB family radical SAM enzyme
VDKLLKKIEPLSKYFDEVVFTGGEALLLKEIFLIASEFKRNGIMTRIITNGTLLTPDVCRNIISTFDRVDFSLDSPDSKQNDLTR